MVAGSGLNKDDILGVIPPLNGIATVEKVAANAVMAGCFAGLFSVGAGRRPGRVGNRASILTCATTTGNVAPLVIVNGPCRNTLQINYSSNVLGQGWRANSTIGRALRLVLSNIGGAAPRRLRQSHSGSTGKIYVLHR